MLFPTERFINNDSKVFVIVYMWQWVIINCQADIIGSQYRFTSTRQLTPALNNYYLSFIYLWNYTYCNLTKRIFGFDWHRGDQRFALSLRIDSHDTEIILLALVQVLGRRLCVIRADVSRTFRPFVRALGFLLQHVVINGNSAVVFRWLPLHRYSIRSRFGRFQWSLWSWRLICRQNIMYSLPMLSILINLHQTMHVNSRFKPTGFVCNFHIFPRFATISKHFWRCPASSSNNKQQSTQLHPDFSHCLSLCLAVKRRQCVLCLNGFQHEHGSIPTQSDNSCRGIVNLYDTQEGDEMRWGEIY